MWACKSSFVETRSGKAGLASVRRRAAGPRGTRLDARGVARSAMAVIVTLGLLLVAFGWNPLTSLQHRPEWSVCGQDLCACTPPAAPAAPACPLCPSGSAALSDACPDGPCEAAEPDPPLRWVPDRFDRRVTLALELVALALVLPTGGGWPTLEMDRCAFASITHDTIRSVDPRPIDPPPPRGLGLRA